MALEPLRYSFGFLQRVGLGSAPIEVLHRHRLFQGPHQVHAHPALLLLRRHVKCGTKILLGVGVVALSGPGGAPVIAGNPRFDDVELHVRPVVLLGLRILLGIEGPVAKPVEYQDARESTRGKNKNSNKQHRHPNSGPACPSGSVGAHRVPPAVSRMSLTRVTKVHHGMSFRARRSRRALIVSWIATSTPATRPRIHDRSVPELI